LRATALTAPATVYVALFTADPTDANATAGEVTGGAYARQTIAFSAPTNGVFTNSGIVTFPTATANWGTITHFAIYDAATVGNLLVYGVLSTPKQVLSGDVFKFNASGISITFQ
jgi:hypothetical protein